MENKIKSHLEELDILGYTVIEDVLSQEELKLAQEKILQVYDIQKQETEGVVDITKTVENNIARMPFSYDEYFYNLLNNNKIIPYIKEVLGDYFILQTQNGVIVQPNITHSQNKWHRDLSYMNFVSDPPLAINRSEEHTSELQSH